MERNRALLCGHAANRPAGLASTSEPDMFVGVALVCPTFLNLLQQTRLQSCVLVGSASNDSDCWCVPPCGRCQKFFSLAGTMVLLYFAVSTSRLRERQRMVLKRCDHMMVFNHHLLASENRCARTHVVHNKCSSETCPEALRDSPAPDGQMSAVTSSPCTATVQSSSVRKNEHCCTSFGQILM